MPPSEMPGVPFGQPSCAVVLPVRLFGGHEKMLLEWLSHAAAEQGLRVQIHGAPNDRLIRACEAAGLGRPIVSFPPAGSGLRDAFATWRLLARIPRQIPIVFAPGVVQASPLLWLAALLRRRKVAGYVPMAYSTRHMRFRGGAMRDWVVRQMIRRVHLWITITGEQRKLLIDHWRVTSPVLVVPNRLRFARRYAPARESGIARPLRVLFAGRFEPNQKGLDWLCARLRSRRDAWRGRLRFTFKGQGAFRAELLRLSAELGSRHVRVSDWGEVGEAMRETDVLLVPSRFEGLPLVALEAAHYGIPVVASRNSGLAELLPPSCLFEFGDEEAMWAALDSLADPAARAAVLAHLRGRIELLLSAASFSRAVAQLVAALARLTPSAPMARVELEGALAMADVVVVIRTLNESRWLGRVLDAVAAQRGIRPLPLIVDSGSTDGTVEIAQAKGARVESLPGRFTFGYALNWAMQRAHTELVAFVSGHAVPAGERWLGTLVAPFGDPAVAGTFGRQLPHEECFPLEAESVLAAYPRSEPLPRGVKFSNANAAVRRSCWEALRFDEDVPGCEDAIWADAVRAAGWQIRYAPDAAVYHSHNDDFRMRYQRSRREAAAWARAFPHDSDSRLPALRAVAAAGAGIATDLLRAARGQLPLGVAVGGVPYRLAKSLGRAAGIRDARRARENA